MLLPATVQHTATYPDGPTIDYLLTELEDKIILHIRINGAMDSTFEIPVSASDSMRMAAGIHSEEALIEPKLIVGDHASYKIQVVAGQLAKLVMRATNPKDTILTIGSRWFGKGDEAETEDFDKLMFVAEHLGVLLEKRAGGGSGEN